jgi:hypothetical protein
MQAPRVLIPLIVIVCMVLKSLSDQCGCDFAHVFLESKSSESFSSQHEDESISIFWLGLV